jgi:hypothetical protein
MVRGKTKIKDVGEGRGRVINLYTERGDRWEEIKTQERDRDRKR